MKRRMVVISGVLLGVLVLTALVGATTAFAQDPTPPTKDPLGGGMRGMGWGGWFGGPGNRWAAFDAAADALGMTPVELFTALHSGKTLAEVAEEQGVDLETVQEAIRAARVEAMRNAIEQAVEDGRMSQEEANWLLEGLENGYRFGWRALGRGRHGGCLWDR